MIKDPVCGMELEKEKSHSRISFKGKEFYFCSDSCDDLFKQLNGLKIAEDKKPGQIDIDRKMVAYNTLKQLAVTIAHYIRNANATISAQAQLYSGSADRKTLQNSAFMIERQSEKIEAVVSALLSLSDIKLQKYAGSAEEAIMDLRNTLEDKIKED